jgi:cardiolipin synthase
MTIPNLITVLRLILVPLVILAISDGRWLTAFLLFVVAGLSDAADGAIARRFNMRTEFGAYLDPLADKALLVSIYIAMSIVEALPRWLAITVVSRDLMIVAAIILSRLMDRPMEIRPLLVSKVNTAVQIAFAAGILAVKAFSLEAGWLVTGGMAAVAALTVVSAAAYLARWLRHMAGV